MSLQKEAPCLDKRSYYLQKQRPEKNFTSPNCMTESRSLSADMMIQSLYSFLFFFLPSAIGSAVFLSKSASFWDSLHRKVVLIFHRQLEMTDLLLQILYAFKLKMILISQICLKDYWLDSSNDYKKTTFRCKHKKNSSMYSFKARYIQL